MLYTFTVEYFLMNKIIVFLAAKRYVLVLTLIALFALSLRLYKLAAIPDGFFCDEAAAGYDAFSIIKTGYDTHAKFLPFYTQRFDLSYMEAMYTYLTAPFIFLFGLNIFAVRLSAAIIGTLTTITTYFFAKKLFNKNIGIVAAFLLAVSPWHLPITRWGHEASLVPFFTTLGLFLLLKSFHSAKWAIPAAITFGLSLYAYPVMKVFIPLAIIIVSLFYLKQIAALLKSERNAAGFFLAAGLIFLLISLPPYELFLSGQGSRRFNSISVFNSAHPLSQFFINFLAHLSPNFIFVNGDYNLRHGIPGFGKIMIFLSPFIIYSFYLVFTRRDWGPTGLRPWYLYYIRPRGATSRPALTPRLPAGVFPLRDKNIILLAILFLAGLIPASLTNDKIPHALRAITGVPFVEIIAAAGVFYLLKNIRNIAIKIVMITLILANILFFLHAYFVIYPPVSQDWFSYGWKEAIEYARDNSQRYDRVVLLSSRYAYVYVLFFAKINPGQFRKTAKMDKYVVYDKAEDECYRHDGRTLFVVDYYESINENRKYIISKLKYRVKKFIYNQRKQIVFAITE